MASSSASSSPLGTETEDQTSGPSSDASDEEFQSRSNISAQISAFPEVFPSHEARFMSVEDGLSRFCAYFGENSSRIPTFFSSNEAELELRSLYSRLKELRTKKLIPEQFNIEERLEALQRHHKYLSEEEERISKLRKINEETAVQESSEYSDIKAKIHSARKQLRQLQRSQEEEKSALEIAQQALKSAQSELNSRNLQINSLKEEEKNLRALEKQAKMDIQKTEQKIASEAKEEEKIDVLDSSVLEAKSEAKRLTKILEEKHKLLQSHHSDLQEILEKADKIEAEISFAVKQSEAVAKTNSEEVVNLESSIEMTQSSDGDLSYVQEKSILAKTPPVAEPAPIKSALLEKAPFSAAPASTRKAPAEKQNLSLISPDLISNAMKALNMEIADDSEMRSRIEASTSEWDTYGLF